MASQAADHQRPDDTQQILRSDLLYDAENFEMTHMNESNRADIMKKYLVYMELPKIKIGDYRKSSCVSGNVIRFHFLLRIAKDEANTILRLLPIKAYKAPVVNFAVIHRPFLDDEDAKGPIPKSPGIRSPLILYPDDDTATAAPDTKTDDIVEDFGSDKPPQQASPEQQQPPKLTEPMNESPPRRQLEVESPSRHIPPDELEPSPTQFLSDDHLTAQTDTSAPGYQKHRRPKKYFVYCEIPKVLIGDYRNSSVVCSEIIHAHFLMKIAKDEASGQPQLQPIRRYHRPKVNFAVIHRSLIVDDEAIGPIPRNPNVKSPMIKEDDDSEEEQLGARDNILHATMGFCYGRLPRSKYELISQWSMVPGDKGLPYPELVLSKAEA